MSADRARSLGLKPKVTFRGFAVAGCDPDEMGIGPVFAVPRLLQRHGLKVDDIGLWELNEAFAVQVVYCRDRLGIDPNKLNVNGGSIAIGHPFGMTGSRLVGVLANEMQRRKAALRRSHYVHRRRTGCGRSVRIVLIGLFIGQKPGQGSFDFVDGRGQHGHLSLPIDEDHQGWDDHAESRRRFALRSPRLKDLRPAHLVVSQEGLDGIGRHIEADAQNFEPLRVVLIK